MERIMMKINLTHWVVLWWMTGAAFLTGTRSVAQTCTAEPLPFATSLPSREITSLYQDREGFFWIGTTFGVARYDGYETTIFKSSPAWPDRLTDNSISLVTDTEHRVFIGTQNGLNVLNKQTWTLSALREGPFAHTEIKYVYSDRHSRLWIATAQALYLCNEDLRISRIYDFKAAVTSICEDRKGHLWILTWGKGMFRWDEKQKKFNAYPPIGMSNNPFVLYQDSEERYWLGTWSDGLYRFFPEKNGKDIFVRQAVPGDIFFDIEEDEYEGNLWMLSYDALHIFKSAPDGTLSPVPAPEGLDPNRMFSTILKDRNGDLWLGAFDAGFHVFFSAGKPLGYSMPFIKEALGFDTNLNCMYEDPEGVLWFNQERNGLGLYIPTDNRYALHPYPQVRNFEINFISPSRQPNSVWLSSAFVPVVFRAERLGMDIRFTDTLRLAQDGSQTGHILNHLEDSAGNLWVLTERKLFAFTPYGTPLQQDDKLRSHHPVQAICEDHKGRIWMGTGDGRLFQAIPSSVSFTAEPKDGGATCPDPNISHICSDRKDGLWIATALGGLYHFSLERKTWTDHTATCLPDMPLILSLWSEGQYLWVVTPGNVICYEPDTKTRHSFQAKDKHSPVHSFRNRAACLTRKGMLYAGGHGGFIAINTATPLPHPHMGILRLTDLCIEGKSLSEIPDSPTKISGHHIVLSPNASRTEFCFSVPSCPDPENIRMAYRLEGLDTTTIMLEKGEHKVLYNRLPKGSYNLNVWQIDEKGRQIGSITTYDITKLPAWYETWVAFLIYILTTLSFLTFLIKFYVKRIQKKNALLLREEMTRTKLEYFTNMSHELLTPLTILSCLSDEIEQNGLPGSPVVQSMRDNVNRLKKLIRQVLDFRKIEQKNLPLQVQYGDVSSFVRRIGQADFTLLAQKKDIDFHMDCMPEEVYGFYDADKLEEMLFNLLSNAIKYTPSRHAVGIRLRTAGNNATKRLHLEVWDEGNGIAPEEQNKVFTRFYRSPQSTGAESNGIGLSLTRELVTLHHGTLTLESTIGKGSCFTLEIPLDETAYTTEEKKDTPPVSPAIPASSPIPASNARSTLLIVDDNTEITDSIGRLMEQRYQILPAHSAAEAAPLLQNQNIDLMVCDLRMPGMNGLDFCRMIKGDLATSHIPVIILTAQDSDDTRAACYEAGADGYVAKPFRLQVLTARIDNLLHQYRQYNRNFLHTPDMGTDSLPYQDRDKLFLQDLIQAVESHLADSEFKLDSLSSELRLSKSTMNRKIKTMTGLTPMDFVKGVRLRAACRLLHEGKMTVAEIAYTVGFSDPKYFTKCFKEEYGQTPSQYQEGK